MPLFPLLIIIASLSFASLSYGQDETPDADANMEEATEESSQPAPDESSKETATPESSAQDTGMGDTKVSRVLPNPASRRTAEVLKYLSLFQRDKEILSFNDEANSINGLYMAENTGSPQGGVLILHDIEQHAHWPDTIGPIREYLPDYGWNTLSLFFGNHIKKPLPKIPEKSSEQEEGSETSDETQVDNTPPEIDAADALTEETMAAASDEASEDEADPIDNNEFDAPADELEEIASGMDQINDITPNLAEAMSDDDENDIDISEILLQNMQERVDIGLAQLNNLGQFNIVLIAQGLSANWAVASLVERFENNPELVGYALILIDAKTSEYPDYDLNENLAKLQIPILDIHTNKSAQVLRKVRERRNAVRRTQNKRYWQIQLPAVRTRLPQKHNMITRRVRGWLNTHAAGEEVNVKG